MASAHENLPSVASFHSLAEQTKAARVTNLLGQQISPEIGRGTSDAPVSPSKISTWTRRGFLASLGAAALAYLSVRNVNDEDHARIRKNRKVVAEAVQQLEQLEGRFVSAQMGDDAVELRRILEEAKKILQKLQGRSDSFVHVEEAKTHAFAGKTNMALSKIPDAEFQYVSALGLAGLVEKNTGNGMPEAAEWKAILNGLRKAREELASN